MAGVYGGDWRLEPEWVFVNQGVVMDIEGLNELLPLVSALAPGFIILFFRSQFISGRLPGIKEGAFYYIIISLAYYALAVPMLSIIGLSAVCQAFALFFVLPFTVGIFFGLSYQKGWTRWVTRKLGLKVMHAAPCAWDYAFGQLNGYSWIMVELRDGRRIRGLFGPASFASAGDDGSDIFIEEVTGNDFGRMERKAGVWISKSDISVIEIIPD